MVDDSDSDVEASLARLRQFLAPHKLDQCCQDERLPPREDKQELHTRHPGCLGTATVDKEVEIADVTSSALSPLTDQCYDHSQDVPRAAAGRQVVSTVSQLGDYTHAVVDSPSGHFDLSSSAEPQLPLAATSTVSPVSVSSNEYTRVKHLLKCSLPGYCLHDDVVMWDMKNPALHAQYESRSLGLLQLESWVEVDQLSSVMGSSQSEQYAKFTAGDILLDSLNAKNGRKQLVLCRIAVGRSVVVDCEEEASALDLPNGYHSFYIKRGVRSDVVGANEQSYRHEYLLRDALRVLPLYLIRFSYSVRNTKTSRLCMLCEVNQATVICKACDAELCSSCDCQVHSANKLVERHKRVSTFELPNVSSRMACPRIVPTQLEGDCFEKDQPEMISETLTDSEVNLFVKRQVDGSADIQTVCNVHEGKKIEFYCPTCATPVCVNCKMVGDHSIGEKGSHRLLSISDTYEHCLRESFKSDPLVDSRKSLIENKLTLLSRWKADIESNREEVEAAIKQQCDQALASLTQETRNKMRILDGEVLELRRQLQHIDWLDDRLAEQRAACSTVDFLSTWNQHKILRAEQRDFPTSPLTPLGGDQIKANLRLIGNLQVVAGDRNLPRLSFSGSDFGDQYESDRCGSLSPRETPSGVCSPPDSARRHSENDIRRRLLSLRSIEMDVCDRPSVSPGKVLAGVGTLSPQGRKMMEEIRNDLISRRTTRSRSSSMSPSLASPGSSPCMASVASSLRAFSIQPARLLPTTSSASAPQKQRAGVAAWTALLRHELAACKEPQPELTD